MLRTDGRYSFGIEAIRIQPLNDDLTIPTVIRIIGGAGPFDFSGVSAIGAVVLKVKLDNETVEDLTVDLAAAVIQSAVTVAELVTALDTTFTAAALELDASLSVADDNRLKIESTDTATTPDYVQIYGECAEIAMLGQGVGAKFHKLNTAQTFALTPVRKDAEQITITDAKGQDTEINTDDYLKGFTAVLTDTAQDWALRAVIEGGTLNAAETDYEFPTSESPRIYFFAEIYRAAYSSGEHLESDLVGYTRYLLRTMRGSLGDRTMERNWTSWVYNIVGTSYTDEDGDLLGAINETQLTITAFAALNVLTV